VTRISSACEAMKPLVTSVIPCDLSVSAAEEIRLRASLLLPNPPRLIPSPDDSGIASGIIPAVNR